MSITVSTIDTPLTPKTSNSISAPSSTPSTPVIDNTGSQDQDTEITSGKNAEKNVNKPSNIAGVNERAPLHEIDFNTPVRKTPARKASVRKAPVGKDCVTSKPRKKHPVKKQNLNDQSNMNKISDIHSAAEPLRKGLTNNAAIIVDESKASEPQTQNQISVKRFGRICSEIYMNRSEFIKKHPELHPRQLTILLAKTWKSMSKAEKRPYYKMVQEKEEKYKKEMQEYEDAVKLVKLNEEQDAPYDIDPFPQYPDFQSMLNAPLSFGPFESISEESFNGDDQKVNGSPSVLVKYEPLNEPSFDANDSAPSTPSLPQYFPSNPTHTYVDRVQQMPSIFQQPYKQFRAESQYTPPIKSEFTFVQNNNNLEVPNLAIRQHISEHMQQLVPQVNNNNLKVPNLAMQQQISDHMKHPVPRVNQDNNNLKVPNLPMQQQIPEHIRQPIPRVNKNINLEVTNPLVNQNNNHLNVPNLVMKQQIPEHMRQPVPLVNQNMVQRSHQIIKQSHQTPLIQNSRLPNNTPQNVVAQEMPQNNNYQQQPHHVMPNYSTIWQRHETIAQKMPSQQECLQTPSQRTLQQIQAPQQMRYSQQISTNPNMISLPQTPNISHAQISRQMNNGLSFQSLNQQQQVERQLRSMQQQMPYQTWRPMLMYSQDMSGKASQQTIMSYNTSGQIIPLPMPQQIPQNMQQRLWQTIPNQMNNQFSSYESTQQFQQQNRSMLYSPLNNQQLMSNQINNSMRPQIQPNPQMK
ncbi:11518_t:CDS:2, partial [Cetraspora pellucida]